MRAYGPVSSIFAGESMLLHFGWLLGILNCMLGFRRLVYCSQDQWDIHKLDPYYDCTVKKYPGITTISLRNAAGRETNLGPTPLGKRPYDNLSNDGMQDGPNKRVHRDVTMESVRSGATTEDEAEDEAEGDQDGDEDEDEENFVAEMVADENQYRNPAPPTSRPTPKRPPATPRTRPPPTPRAAKPVSQAAPPTAGPSSPIAQTRGQSVPPEESGKKRKGMLLA